MKFLNTKTNCIIEAVNDAVLPSDEDEAEITYYAANELVKVSTKTRYSGKLKLCENADELVDELTKSPTNPPKENPDNSYPTERTKRGIKPTVSTCEAENGDYITDLETGETVRNSRTAESLRQSWAAQRELIYNCVAWQLGIFMSVTLNWKPSFGEMSALAAKFGVRLKRRYAGIAGFIFLEPCKDGKSWHVHFILGFVEKIPNDFGEWAKGWWSNFNTVKSTHQVHIRRFKSFEDLKETVDYLNPTSFKKIALIDKYPANCQSMRHFGDVKKPNKALCSVSAVKKISGREKPAMRKTTTVTDAETNVVIYAKSECFFDSRIFEYHHKKTVTNPREAPNFVNRFNDYVYDNYIMRC